MWALLCRSFGWALADYDRFAAGTAGGPRARGVGRRRTGCVRTHPRLRTVLRRSIRTDGRLFAGRGRTGVPGPWLRVHCLRGRTIPCCTSAGSVLSGLYPATNALVPQDRLRARRHVGTSSSSRPASCSVCRSGAERRLDAHPNPIGARSKRATHASRGTRRASSIATRTGGNGLRRPRPTDLRRRRHERCGRRIRAVPIALAADGEPRDAAGRRAHGRRPCSRAGALAPRRHVVFDRTHVQDHRTAGPLPAVVAARTGSRRIRRVALDGASHRRARSDRGARLRTGTNARRVGARRRSAVRLERRAPGNSSSKEARAGSRGGDGEVELGYRCVLQPVHRVRVALATREAGLLRTSDPGALDGARGRVRGRSAVDAGLLLMHYEARRSVNAWKWAPGSRPSTSTVWNSTTSKTRGDGTEQRIVRQVREEALRFVDVFRPRRRALETAVLAEEEPAAGDEHIVDSRTAPREGRQEERAAGSSSRTPRRMFRPDRARGSPSATRRVPWRGTPRPSPPTRRCTTLRVRHQRTTCRASRFRRPPRAGAFLRRPELVRGTTRARVASTPRPASCRAPRPSRRTTGAHVRGSRRSRRSAPLIARLLSLHTMHHRASSRADNGAPIPGSPVARRIAPPVG